MTALQYSCTLIIAALLLATTIVQASYVDLYKDANYKNKLSRIEDIERDHCYSIACDALDNTITSAKWSGLPEKTSAGDDAMISFYIDRDCREHDIWWRTKTQSHDDLDFPSNFRLDGMNDRISAFMVWNTKKIRGTWLICTTESETLDASGSGSRTNETVGDL
ncbi:Epsin-1, required for endocytosis and actin patch assembly [Phytophthora pseudosyringae]|uniref:Epsin-1, required for endocytosis and actin patch assembly n=1 Tax=Phytophthora pseudosyringae TaxID=221518 RepID=A0A8T1VR50_9STRA|nr:Epsin-1, required for endocytosis and actin patch assembly [Phytophthora pseudosyringae]